VAGPAGNSRPDDRRPARIQVMGRSIGVGGEGRFRLSTPPLATSDRVSGNPHVDNAQRPSRAMVRIGI
jgi:hypothetical protein